MNGSGLRITGGRLPLSLPPPQVLIAQRAGDREPRSYRPAAPIAGTVGIRITFLQAG